MNGGQREESEIRADIQNGPNIARKRRDPVAVPQENLAELMHEHRFFAFRELEFYILPCDADTKGARSAG